MSRALSLVGSVLWGLLCGFVPLEANAQAQSTKPDLLRSALTWQLIHEGTTRASLSTAGSAIQVNVTATDPEYWRVQLSQPRIALEEGHTYTLRYSAMADQPRQLELGAYADTADKHRLASPRTERLIASWRPFVYTFTAQKVVPSQSLLTFFVGQEVGTVKFKDLSLSEGKPSLDELIDTVKPTPDESPATQIDWRLDINKARQESQDTGKPLLIWLSSEPPLGPC